MPNLMRNSIVLGFALAVAGAATHAAERRTTMELTSSAFAPQGDIPPLHTCDGHDQSPPLAWSGVPAGTKSLALIVDDPDAPDPAAPKMIWVHWVVYNIPPDTTGLATGAQLPGASRQGVNDSRQERYSGPCPPIGRHRYVHKLYALDTVLPVLRPATKASLEKAMQGHILGRAELVGYYQRKR